DDVYTVKMPKSLQKNRHLVRYRILATDTTGISIRGPYDDDMGHNFAYFVYDGTPDWSGSVRRNGSKITFPGSLMSSIPTYFLLTKASSVTGSQFGGYGGAEYKWKGTMIYDGKVYDHIRYRPRGGVHRYQYGKNFWKFDFNRGRRFQARDRGGNKYKTKWDKLNFSSIVQQVNFGHRGEQGLFESVGFKLFELCGVEACKTHYLQFYVIDDESPTGSDQYSTDYYGLYLAIEQMDGQFLDQNGMPDGNLYKIEGHSGTSNNQGPTQVTNRSDVTNFIRGYRNQNPSADWWRENLDVDKYLSYRVIVEGIHHYDIAYGKNYYYYHNPETNKFQVHPWDLDLTWANNMYGNGNHDFKTKVANNSAFRTDYRNRVREIMDLIYNDDEGYKLIDEMAHDVWSPEGPTLVEADRRLWDNHPRLNHKDRYYDISPTRDFAGMKEVLRRYITSRGNWMKSSLLQDRNSTPEKPTITFIGGDNYQVDDLKFSSSSYRSQSNSRFAAMEWRLAEVYNPTVEGYVEKDPYIYEIENPAKSGELDKFEATYQFLPTDARVDRTYRARVRHKDQSGRWSNWSDPIQFKVSSPDISTYAESLRITEVNYHPIEATVAEQEKGWTASDFEYIEIQNISNNDLELTNLRFTKGIDFDFKPGSIIKTGEYLLIVRNRVALESRYGAGLPIAGEWEADNKLDNAGENIKLSFGAGTPIIEVTYDDKEPWPISADGDGFTLNLTDPKNVSQENHGEATNWYSGVASPGSEGGNAALTFNIWASDNGLDPGASKTDDPDSDGIINLMEYALNSNPIAISRGDLPQIAMQTLDLEDQPKEYITYSFTRQGQTSDLIYSVEVSEDLKKWEKGTAILESSTTNADGTIKEMWRSPMNSSAKTKWFFRLVVKG
ncbi:MAG: CotH kinase family protein, partial [Verrucomicrobiota bacterium]|nr:CotH kinase family protein [Verrucomicrobiota bacterium]